MGCWRSILRVEDFTLAMREGKRRKERTFGHGIEREDAREDEEQQA